MLQAHKPLHDPTVNRRLIELLQSLTADQLSLDAWSTPLHCEIFKNWLLTGSHSSVIGLEYYGSMALCQGTSAAIETFVQRNHSRRIRFSRAEFVLSRIVCNSMSVPWVYLEDQELAENDAVILSCPFSGTGNRYNSQDQILQQCTQLNIPVFIDAAYLAIARDFVLNVNCPCITDVAFSLSKPFSTMLRHGIRFTRKHHDDGIQSASNQGILPRINTVISSKLMSEYSKDYVIDQYQQKYFDICKKHSLTPTNTITLAQGNLLQHAEFERSGYVRVCITDELLS